MTRTNEYGQPIGFPVPGWKGVPRPGRTVMTGRYCRLEPLDPARHAEALFRANSDPARFTYAVSGPFATLEDYRAWITSFCLGDDPLFYAIVDAASGLAAGIASYLRIDPKNGVIEVGHINYSPALARTRAATEAMYLMMKHVFELGYRRYEWKCDSLNAPSRAAAKRLGFTYEGIFRQALVYKGRNRDTAWFAMIDSEWPALQRAFERWLDPANFDADGRQHERLSDLTAAALASVTPQPR